jgi:dienelactone hydrolase
VTRTCLLLTFALLLGAASAQTTALPQGQIIKRVATEADPQQTYALYLPTNYDSAKQWPIVFMFEPLARGPLPLSLAKDAAEKLGYILVASNNSRNGPLPPEIEAGNAMWRDAHQRFSIDPHRTYFAGLSGGSRLAIIYAANCKACAAGVIASGAAFPNAIDPSALPKLQYFGTVGYEDFNYGEYVAIEPKLKKAGYTFHLARFDGAHEWPPPEIWLEAFEWFNLQAMKSGSLPHDDKFISDAYSRALVKSASQKTDLDKFRAYSQAANDFATLTNIDEARKHASELESSKAVKELTRLEQDQLQQQRRLTAPISEQLTALQDPDRRASAQLELHSLFDHLNRTAANDKAPNQLGAKRARMQEIINIYETGVQMIANHDYPNAMLLYDTLIANQPAAPGAHLQKSRIYLLTGNKSKALSEIRLAIKDGLTDPGAFRDPEFATLNSDPAFTALLNSLQPAKPE